MIRWSYAFIDRPFDGYEAALKFWPAVTGTVVSPRRGDLGQFATLVPATGDACVKVQAVGDQGGAHIDLCVDDVVLEARRAGALGATEVFAEPGLVVMRSPAGLAFCLVDWDGESALAPGGVDQVCIDLAPGAFEPEIAFWAALTGWESSPGSLPEFHRIQQPAGLPVRILLQRLDSDRPASAHIDLACGPDVPAVRALHEHHGATLVAQGHSWVVMRDPAGGVYCLTGRPIRE
ncbi:VOC family protein [Allorhizocola rhizosphaerae]|uniref:VOC family protein n=1 Tax=Allorhizocola rhizosphaerae TaxID=1872709 RepID=UPI000E3DAEB6|nr:VOC family protein [Allorhizocola rhizosphaerae]